AAAVRALDELDGDRDVALAVVALRDHHDLARLEALEADRDRTGGAGTASALAGADAHAATVGQLEHHPVAPPRHDLADVGDLAGATHHTEARDPLALGPVGHHCAL